MECRILYSHTIIIILEFTQNVKFATILLLLAFPFMQMYILFFFANNNKKIKEENTMTSKELLYVEDALAHEQFLKSCACKTSSELQDQTLKDYLKELENKHDTLFQQFLNLL